MNQSKLFHVMLCYQACGRRSAEYVNFNDNEINGVSDRTICIPWSLLFLVLFLLFVKGVLVFCQSKSVDEEAEPGQGHRIQSRIDPFLGQASHDHLVLLGIRRFLPFT